MEDIEEMRVGYGEEREREESLVWEDVNLFSNLPKTSNSTFKIREHKRSIFTTFRQRSYLHYNLGII